MEDDSYTIYGHGESLLCVMQPREEDDTCKETNIYIYDVSIRQKINKRCTTKTNEKPKIYTHRSLFSLASSASVQTNPFY